jgi:hypothetical protein
MINMLVFGCVVTVIWLVGLGLVVYLNFDKAVLLELNAWGDFLAGSFAPLAFFWLVIGYFQQGKELRLNRGALALQAEELRNSVEQQRELVRATQEDIAFAKAEAEGAKLKVKRLAQPVFSVQDSGIIYFQGDEALITVSLINYGSEIKNIAVSVGDSSLYRTDNHGVYNWKSWRRDDVVAISVICDKLSLPRIESLQFNVVYLDGITEISAVCIWVDIRDGQAVGLSTQPAKVA